MKLPHFKMSEMNGEIAYNVKGQRKDTYPNAEVILQKSISYPVSSLMKLTLSFLSYALQKPTAFWVRLSYFIRTHFHSDQREMAPDAKFKTEFMSTDSWSKGWAEVEGCNVRETSE